jgi:chemotaxis protein methyltransferase CheR
MIQTLNDGGYLMTGHAELMGIELPGLNKRLFSESLLYQRGIDSSAVLPPPVTVSRPVATRIKRPAEHKPQRARQTPVVKPEVVKTQQVNKAQEGTSARLTELKNLMARHDYLSVVEKAAVEPKSSQHFPDIACFRAEAYANLGDYDKAAATCRQIIEAKPFHCRAHYLLAQVTEAQGDQKSAVQLFKKVIYLDPLFIPGYLELASLLHASDSSASARKMWSAALKVLKKMPSNEVVECYEEMNIDELTRHVEMMMGEAG